MTVKYAASVPLHHMIEWPRTAQKCTPFNVPQAYCYKRGLITQVHGPRHRLETDTLGVGRRTRSEPCRAPGPGRAELLEFTQRLASGPDMEYVEHFGGHLGHGRAH